MVKQFHAGGKIPVRGDTLVLVSFKDGYEETMAEFNSNEDKTPFRADYWPEKFWTHDVSDEGLMINGYTIITEES